MQAHKLRSGEHAKLLQRDDNEVVGMYSIIHRGHAKLRLANKLVLRKLWKLKIALLGFRTLKAIWTIVIYFKPLLQLFAVDDNYNTTINVHTFSLN